MTEALAAAAALALAVVGVCGIVVPVLPGSITIAAGLLVWALWGGSPAGWWIFGVGIVLLAAGASAQYLITGRSLRRRDIPHRSVVVGLVAGVIGLVVIPFLGLPIGFAAGLLGAEYLRVRDLRTAAGTSWAAVRSVGLGVAIELSLALVATVCLLAGVIWHLVG